MKIYRVIETEEYVPASGRKVIWSFETYCKVMHGARDLLIGFLIGRLICMWFGL